MSSRIQAVTAERTTRPLLVLVLGTLLMVGLFLVPGPAQAENEPEARSDYLVAFASGVAPEASDSTLAAAEAVVSASIPALRLYAVSLTDTGAQTLRADESVTRVEADLVREVQGEPDDPAYGDQWALPQIGWDTAYASTTPTGSATVAVLDTGVNPTDDLAGQLVPGASMVAGVEGTNDPNGHGTAMASIVAAGVDNGTGIAGVGYRGVSVMPVKVLDESGLGQDSAIVEGVVYAADHGADVILMAFSNPGRSNALQAAADYAWSKGAVLVAATGNDGSTADTFPAGLAKVVGVSATTRDDAVWSGSNSGDDTFLAAPGVDISSGSGSLTGTSASAAIAAGAAALVKANDPSASNGVVVGRLARTADAAGTVSDTGNGRVNLARALADVSTDPVVPAGVAGAGGPIVGPYVMAANNDAHVAPGWAPTNTTTTFSTLYRKTSGGPVQHVRITLPVGYTSISVAATAFSSGTWSAPVVNQTNRTVDVQLATGTGLATDNVDWARIDVTATTPPANQSGNAADWLMQTFTNTAGTTGEQNDNPPVLIGATTTSQANITFIDAGGTPIATPVLQNGVASTVRVRLTQTAGSGIKYTDVAVPTCFSSPTAVTATVSAGGNPYDTPIVVTDGFIRLPGGAIAANGTLTVQFTTTPNCTSGTYLVSSDPSTNASNPPSGTNQSVSTTGGSLTVAAGLADLSITKTDSPDPVEPGGALTYTIGVSNAGPNDASAVKVVDTLPAGATLVSATGTNWNCSGTTTVTCNRTGGNLAPGAAPNITLVVTAPLVGTSLTNSATVSSPNDNTPGNNTATATTTINNNAAPSLTVPTFAPASPTTNANLQASTTTSDPDGDQVKVDWVWKLTRGGNTCTIKTDTSPLAPAGTRSSSLDLSTSYPTSGCTGPNLGSVNPSRDDVIAVEATPTDAPGATGTTMTSNVTVANSAPVVTLSGSNDLAVNEGTTHTYSYTISDADGDAINSVATSCSGTGSKVSGSDTNTNTSGSFQCTFADGPNTSTVSAAATDSTGAAGAAATQTVTVANVAPTVVLSGADTADEGQTKTYTYTVSDPGADAGATTVVEDCGANGVRTDTAAVDSFECTFPDGPNSSTVSVSADDGDPANNTGSDEIDVTVANVAPTVVLSGADTADEGQTKIYTYTVSDPGTDAGATTVVEDCGAHGVRTDTAAVDSFECTFPDGPNSSTVSVSANDGDPANNTGSDEIGVTIANVKPSITLTGAATADEGQTKTYSFVVSDPGVDTHTVTTACGAEGEKVAGSQAYDATAGEGSFQCFFADGPATTNVTATVTDSDGATDTDNQVVVVTVNNVAPVVTLAAGNDLSVDEGSQHSYDFTVTDSGADTFTVVSVSCGANGTQVGPTTTTATGGSFECTFPDGPASSTVSVQVKDSDNALSNTDTQTVTVANVAPTVVLDGADTADEGQTRTYTYTVSDPGTDAGATTVVEDCGAHGVRTDTPAVDSFECTFPDGPNSSVVSVSANDGDPANNIGSDEIDVTIANVAPVVTLDGADTADEGQTRTYTYTVSDAGADAGATTVVEDCGANGVRTDTPEADSFECTFPDGPNSSTVSVSADDGDPANNTGSDEIDVTIANVAPVVTLDGADTADEGQTKTYTYTVSDAGADAGATTVVEDCGAHGVRTDTPEVGSFECTFPDGPASSVVSVSANDGDPADNTGSDEITVAVANVKPTVSLSGAATADEGETKTYSFTVADPGADSFVLDETSCGAGGTQVGADAFNTTTGAGSFECTFPDGPASPTVSVTVSDSDGASDTDAVDVAVANVKPSITLTGAATADEGQTKTYSFVVSDPGADTHTVTTACGAEGEKVTGSQAYDATAGEGSFQCFFADGPATTNVTATVTDSDGATDTDNQVVVVTVNNVAPVVTLAAGNDLSVDEGSQHSYDFTVTDSGADTFTVVSVSCGTNGTQVGPTTTTATGGSFACRFPDGPNSSTVSVQVKDSDNALSNTDTQTVTVANVAPTVVLDGADTADEGQTKTYTYTVSDAGADAGATTVVEDCGAHGTRTDTPEADSFECTFPDGPKSSTVSVSADDGDPANNTGSDEIDVTIANVAPVVTLDGADTADEGQTRTYTYTVSDAGADAGATTVVEDCGAHGTRTDTPEVGSFECTFPDGPASSVVSVSANDGDPADNTGSDEITVAVANVKPTVSLSGAATADEGETKTYSFTVADPGADSFVLDETSCGAGGTQVGVDAFNTTTGAGSFECTFPDGPASPTVSVTVSDSDGASDTDAFDVAVANVKPTVSLTGAATADEGQTKTYSFVVSDPGADSFVLDETSCGAGGTQVGVDAFNTTTGAGSFECTFPDGPASPTVSVTVSDSDGASDTDAFDVAVANVKPTVSLTGAATADEGQTKTYSFVVSDPGADSFVLDETSCGAGGTQVGADAFNTTTGAGSFECTFPDGPASPTVSVTVSDSDGASDTDTVDVAVANIAPTISLTSPATEANVGQTKLYSFTISDPAGAADVQTYVVGYPDCGTGATVSEKSVTSSGGSFKCTFNTAGSSTVSVRVNDGDDDSNTASVVVSVNAAPTVDAGPDVSGSEGSTIALDGTVSDPEGNPFTVKWTYTPGAGVDAGASCTFANDAAVDTTIKCTDDGTFTVTLEATDNKDAKSSDTASVIVSNANPIVTTSNPTPAPSAKNTPVSLTVSFTDAGSNDTHKAPAGGSCTVTWDDGSSSTGTVVEPTSTTQGSCTASHTYAGPGVYTVKMTVTDDDGGSGTATIQVVVYDPSAGFVTGGGFINVGPGSYTADPTLTGRANFGFISQYKKNAMTPTGETEFNFQVGNLNFHSTAYTWLVVSGYKAQYKGTGTINGSGSYDFVLTAYDGQISGGGGADKFRIRITAGNNGSAVVFDNRNGSATDMDVANPQIIAGGSVVIHK